MMKEISHSTRSDEQKTHLCLEESVIKEEIETSPGKIMKRGWT